MKNYFYPVASVLKHAEGGYSQKDVKAAAKRFGIECDTGPSIYVGQFAIYVKTEDKRKIRKLLAEVNL